MVIQNKYGNEFSLSTSLLLDIEVSSAPIPKIIFPQFKNEIKLFYKPMTWTENEATVWGIKKILNLTLKREAGKQVSM